MSDVDFEDWIVEARRVKVADFCRRRSIKILPGDQGQPCPGCGGVDRFSVNLKKNKWYCRKSGTGGDALALAMHIDGTDFIAACETLTGRPPPGRAAAESAAERCEREERLAREARERAEEEARQARVAEQFREDERRRAWKIWRRAVPPQGTLVEAYLAHRGLSLPIGARLKFAERLALWDKPGGAIVHEGPAMVAAIIRPDGRFGGVHQTWIDLSTEKGKAAIVDAKGKELPSKKVRGSKKGGSILLRPSAGAPRRLMIGEGIETVISVLDALAERGSPLLEGAEFRSSVDLDNLCGKAKGRVRHPTETAPDALGRARAVFVGSAEVDFENDWPLIDVPASVEELFLLGDGDSEAFATRLKMERAGKRFSAAHPQLAIYLAMSRAGDDFNKMRMTGRVAA
ncbi:hypothetical protein A1351_20215 [Methylosinus sp. R-45379]|uniref:DUF7146 domain-containing protein n=1 Tax=Methylosinus sp. R-45379 TaxID=980563 RepID=UPI0007C8CF9F|nr:hypothetical protein [Methylosinus sp. R-45379]OAI22895.1 hypothetical protein A1351_20215 [Methylosinus sp. R-45379]